DLVYSGHNFVLDNEVHYTIGMKIAYADGLDPTLAIKLLHRAPRSENIPIRLMNEVEVKIVEVKTLHRAVESSFCFLETGIRDPQLCRHEELITRYAARLDCVTDRLLVSVRGRRIYEAVAYVDRVTNAPLTLRQVVDLENPKTENRHRHPVIQYNLFHIFSFSEKLFSHYRPGLILMAVAGSPIRRYSRIIGRSCKSGYIYVPRLHKKG